MNLKIDLVMSLVFEMFCEMMDNLPPAAAMKAAAVELHLLEEDTAMGREEPVGEVASVLAFCRFLQSGGERKQTLFWDVPLEHRPSYRTILHKLVEAGKLPPAAEAEFESVFGGTLERTTE